MNATRRICLTADPRSADSAPKIDLVKRRNVMRIMARRVKASTVKPHSEGYDAMAWLDDWMRDNKDFSKWPQQLDMIFGSHRLYYLGDLRVRIKNYYKGARTDLAFDLTWRPDLDFDLFPRIVHTPDR